jgi:hypothetical protein
MPFGGHPTLAITLDAAWGLITGAFPALGAALLWFFGKAGR